MTRAKMMRIATCYPAAFDGELMFDRGAAVKWGYGIAISLSSDSEIDVVRSIVEKIDLSHHRLQDRDLIFQRGNRHAGYIDRFAPEALKLDEPGGHLIVVSCTRVDIRDAIFDAIIGPMGAVEISQVVNMTEKISYQDHKSVLQPWVENLHFMQQSVLLAAIRGPDGIRKNHVSKVLLRWYRRCILITAFERTIYETPYAAGGGSFTGPVPEDYIAGLNDSEHIPIAKLTAWPLLPTPGFKGAIDFAVDDYLRTLDELPHHFQLHFMHAAEILGYKHPNEDIRGWWYHVYLRLVNDMHLMPESKVEMDRRLGDSEKEWRRKEEVTAD